MESLAEGARRVRDWLRSADGRQLLLLLAVDVVAYLVAARVLGGSAPGYHDNYSLGYTQRVLASTSLRNGYLPLWDHWSNGGAPLANLFAGVGFSPVVLALSLFGIYSPATFVAEMALVHLLGAIGMFLWLRRHAGRDGAAVGVVAFSLGTYVVCQTPVNFEAAVSVAMLPWIALGAAKALDGEWVGAPILALAGWEMFTAGYLGTNVIALQFIALFTAVERLAFVPREALRPGRLARGVGIALVGAALCAAIFAFDLLEMRAYYAFDVSKIRPVRVDPFQGAARLASLLTLLVPTAELSPPLLPDPWVPTSLFIGRIPLLLAGVALARSRKALLFGAFAALAFAATLSGDWWAGRVLTRLIPLYDQVRFHGWNAGLAVFFLVAVVAMGLEPLAATRAGGFLRGLGGRLVGFAVVAELLAVSALYPFLPRDAENTPPADVVALNERARTSGFPPPRNARLPLAPEFNGHYFTKIPAVAAYQPNRHPATLRLALLGQDQRVLSEILYAADGGGEPIHSPADVRFLEFAPTVVRARVAIPEDVEYFVWSSPHAPAWRLRIDGREQETRANSFGLTGFSLPRGEHLVEFRYRPGHAPAGLALSILGVLGALAILFGCGVRRFARSPGAARGA